MDKQREKKRQRGGRWAGEFHAHGRLFPSYSVQLGTGIEHQ